MESVDFLAMCTCIYSTSRERKRLFGFCFNPRPGSRLGKISRRACAFLDESLAWVLTEVALLRTILSPLFGKSGRKFPVHAPVNLQPVRARNGFWSHTLRQEIISAHSWP